MFKSKSLKSLKQMQESISESEEDYEYDGNHNEDKYA